MRRAIVVLASAFALVLGGLAQANALKERGDAQAARTSWGKKTLAYGPDKLQQLDFYPPRTRSGAVPLVIFVHGGGWKRGSKDTAASKYAPEHFTQLGYAYASLDYRLVPDATVEQQASDIALAVRTLKDRAAELGVDPDRVALMGHSAGAHLVALVGTDERYLRQVGLSFADIRGVIPNDGAAYDVATQMDAGAGFMKDTYIQAFGTDPERQRALSPTVQAKAPNAPAFLLIHVQRADGIAQNKGLEAALKAAGTRVERQEFEGRGLRGHAEINRRLGDPDYPATAVVDRWLEMLFRR